MSEFFQLQLQNFISIIQAPDYWWQIGVLLIAVSLAALVNSRVQLLLESRSDSTVGFRHIAVRSLQRLLWPLVSLILLLPALAVMNRYELPTQLIDIAVPILTALAIVRFVVYLLRKTFTVNPLVRSSENILALTIWLIVIFHLLGWLSPVLVMMDGLAFNMGETRISLLSIINLLVVVAIAFVVAIWLAELVSRQVGRIPGVSPSFKVGVSKI